MSELRIENRSETFTTAKISFTSRDDITAVFCLSGCFRDSDFSVLFTRTLHGLVNRNQESCANPTMQMQMSYSMVRRLLVQLKRATFCDICTPLISRV